MVHPASLVLSKRSQPQLSKLMRRSSGRSRAQAVQCQQAVPLIKVRGAKIELDDVFNDQILANGAELSG